jgi:CRISPR-associated protein Cmr5
LLREDGVGVSTLQQRRAAKAFEQVGDVPEAAHKKYATAAHRMPALIRNAGLCQALHFAESRNDDQGWGKWLGHLAAFLFEQERLPAGGTQALMEASRSAKLSEYLTLTSDTLLYSEWLQRMVRAVLKVEASEAGDAE